MTTRSPLLRKAALMLILMLTIGFAQWFTTTMSHGAAATDSPLPTPWPTLVVTYQATLPTTIPTIAATATAVASNFFRSPLPTPTVRADSEPPQTALSVQGEQNNSDWYRSPVTLTFAITDNIAAGVTEYQLDGDATWTTREYYYPPVTLAEEGIHTLAYRSLDWIKNREAAQSAQIRIDRTPPQTDEPIIDGNQLPNGWYNTPVTVTLAGQDALSGLAGFEGRRAAGPWQPTAATTVITTTGQQTQTWRARDVAGNGSPTQTLALWVDLTPPTTTHTVAALPAGGWYTAPVTVTLTAVDVGAGLFQSQYRLNPLGSWQLYGGPFVVTGSGVQTVAYQSSDRALNLEPSHSFTLPLDLAPPQLTLTRNPPATDSVWSTTPVTVTLAATDDASGVAALRYRLADGADWLTYTTPLLLQPTTVQTLTVVAQDGAGHQSDATVTLGVDRQPPTSRLLLTQPPAAGGWYTQPLTLTLVASDGETGLGQTLYQWPGQAPTVYTQPLLLRREGQTTLTWFAQDRALNQEAPQSHTFALDWTPPLITYTLRGDAVAADWYRSAVRLTVTATDAGAGVAALAYALDDGPWQPYTTTVTLTAGGRHQLHLRAQDAATNRTDLTTHPFGLDTLAPHTTVTLQGGRAANGWYHTPVTVTLTTTDTGAGVATVAWRLNGGAWQVYTMPVVVTSERVNLLEYYAVDGADNQEAPHYIVFSIDRTDPTTRVGLLVGELGGNGWYISPVTLTLSAQDLESGLQVLETAVDDQPWQPYTQPLRLAAEGLHQIRYRAGDAGGRIETTRTLTVALDLTAPAITSTLPATFTYANLTVPAFYTLTDSLSGVVTSTLLLDGAPYAPDQPLPLGSHQVDLTAVNGAGLLTRRTQTFVVVGGRLYLPLIGR